VTSNTKNPASAGLFFDLRPVETKLWRYRGVLEPENRTLRIALLADVHANLEALRACLAHARAQGTERCAFLGDLVGYGADPVAVLDIVAEQVAGGAVAVMGNHDEAVHATRSFLNASAAAAIRWTREQLRPEQREFLLKLPLQVRQGDACYVHASAAMPERWDYVDSPAAAQASVRAAEVPYTFSGHVHDQVLFTGGADERMVAFRPRPGIGIPIAAHRRWLALAGSVGQPRDGNPAAAYAVVDLTMRTLTFHRVAYDTGAAARKVRAAGLPESLAYRLERGI
jgi:diadenosine tetraphosphatase ApaH/serine/threonine PP2A family protein phosphatase